MKTKLWTELKPDTNKPGEKKKYISKVHNMLIKPNLNTFVYLTGYRLQPTQRNDWLNQHRHSCLLQPNPKHYERGDIEERVHLNFILNGQISETGWPLGQAAPTAYVCAKLPQCNRQYFSYILSFKLCMWSENCWSQNNLISLNCFNSSPL